MIFLGAHGGVVRRNPVPHLHISMFAAPGTDAYARFYGLNANNVRWGNVRYGFISGSARGGRTGNRYAVSEINRLSNNRSYLERPGLQWINHLYTGIGMVSQLFAAHSHFDTNHGTSFRYFPIPLTRSQFNSTSITISLLDSVGLSHGMSPSQQRWARGANRHISAEHFGR